MLDQSDPSGTVREANGNRQGFLHPGLGVAGCGSDRAKTSPDRRVSVFLSGLHASVGAWIHPIAEKHCWTLQREEK